MDRQLMTFFLGGWTRPARPKHSEGGLSICSCLMPAGFCRWCVGFHRPSEAQRRRVSSASAHQQKLQPPPDNYRDQQATTPIPAALYHVQTISCDSGV